jgi:Fe-S cluster biosynthesis and repair protein YggX
MKNLDKNMLTAVDDVLKDAFSTENLQKLKTKIKEGSSGTPLAALATLTSTDRTELEHLFYKIRDSIDSKKFGMEFLQNKIEIFLNRGVYDGSDYTPNQQPIKEGVSHGDGFDYNPYIKSLFEYMINRGLAIEPLPKVSIVNDPEQATGIFCKTAHYQPNNQEVVLYVAGRHPKDILRSLSHEMIHHWQNLQGLIGDGKVTTTNTNEDDYLQKLEDQAYLLGNKFLRNWEDLEKNK